MLPSLAPGIACCECNGTAILLDVDRDRYFALSASGNRALLALHWAKTLDDRDRQALDALIARGILRYDVGAMRRPILTEAPLIDGSILDADAPAGFPDLRSIRRAAIALGTASVRMRTRALAVHLRFATRFPIADVDANVSARLFDLGRRFDAARRLLPFGPSCLRDSLALLGFLSILPARPRIVFGVRTDPFRAHCWVQHGGTLLNEACDHARLFTPILVR